MLRWQSKTKTFGDQFNYISINYINNSFIICGDENKIIKYIINSGRSFFYMFEINNINKCKVVKNLSDSKYYIYLNFLENLQKYLDNEIFM